MKRSLVIRYLFAFPYMLVYAFARAAIAKYHRWSGLNNRKPFSHSTRSLRSKIKVSAGGLGFS